MESFRKFIFWCHLAVGVTAGLVILCMASSGIVLAFEPQIVDFAERGVRNVTPAANAYQLDLASIVAKAREANPDARVGSVTLQSSPTASVSVQFGREGSVFVDPYTGRVLGGGSKVHAFMHQVEDFHRWFLVRDIGKAVTGAADLAFLALGLSGLYLWWPRNGKPVLFFDAKATGKARDWNWHNVIGFWCLTFFLITTVTGAVMSYKWANDLLYRAAGTTPPTEQGKGMGPGGRGEGKGKSPEPAVNWNKVSEEAQKKVPGWVQISLRAPGKPDGPVTATIQETQPNWAATPRSQLSLDAATGEAKKWEPYANQAKGKKWRGFIKPIHTGQAAGPIGQAIAALSALGAVLLVYTGFSLALRRFSNWLKGLNTKGRNHV